MAIYTKIFMAYLALMSLISFVQYGVDKSKARRGAYRIRESVLLSFAFLGGALGAVLGMYAFRHKTRHLHFHIVNGFGIVWQAIVLLFMLKILPPSILPFL